MDLRDKYGFNHENVRIYKWIMEENNNDVRMGSCYVLNKTGFKQHTLGCHWKMWFYLRETNQETWRFCPSKDSFFTSRDENIRNENDLPGKKMKKGKHNFLNGGHNGWCGVWFSNSWINSDWQTPQNTGAGKAIFRIRSFQETANESQLEWPSQLVFWVKCWNVRLIMCLRGFTNLYKIVVVNQMGLPWFSFLMR